MLVPKEKWLCALHFEIEKKSLAIELDDLGRPARPTVEY
jgi:hypothetical protein